MQETKKYFPRIALAAIIANLFLTLALPFKTDQICWVVWIQHLQTVGFSEFVGNYPPLYVHWLWVVGKIFAGLGIAVQQGFALKFFCLWPIYFAHIILLRILFRISEYHSWPAVAKPAILWACALNPALLLDGPAWGQVDILPAIFVVASLVAVFSKRNSHWAIPLFIAAVLCKFQAIAALPVLGALFLRNYKHTWKGVPISLALLALVLAPLFATGSVTHILGNAYVHVVGTYPYATDNAANLWMLTMGNLADVNSVPFLHQVKEHLPLSLLTCSKLGKILFSLLALAVFVVSLRIRNLQQAAMSMTLMSVGFFFLLPEMHERYLVGAVPVALLWLATDFTVWPWILALSVISGVNVVMLNGIQGDYLWRYLSIFTTVLFVFLMAKTLVPNGWKRVVSWWNRVPAPLWLPEVALAVCLLACTVFGVLPLRPKTLHLNQNQVWIETLPLLDGAENHHGFNYGQSIGQHPLRMKDIQYVTGIGTHAPSRISFALPKGALRFQAKVGLDQEATAGQLKFIVLVNDAEVWRSPELKKVDEPVNVDVDVSHGERITLVTEASANMDVVVDALDDDNTNSADWIFPRITMGN